MTKNTPTDPTRPPPNADLIRSFEARLKSAQKLWDEFMKRAKDNPANAMEWSGGYYGAAVALHEYPLLLEWVRKGGGTKDKIIAQYTTAAMQGARYPEHSSSATGNIMGAARTSFCAKLVEDLKYFD